MAYVTVPRSLVNSLVESCTVTRDELSAIRDPRRPSRFCGVYSHVHGGRYSATSYRARVFKFFELGSNFESPEAAARAVVAFYKSQFGPDWVRAFRNRRVTPWRLLPVRRDGECVGFAVDLFVRGRPVGVTHADAGGRSEQRYVWRTAESAKAAARAAMSQRFERERGSLLIPAPGLLFWRG